MKFKINLTKLLMSCELLIINGVLYIGQVGGFRGREGFVNGQPMEVGRISFTFELECTSECEFVFMEVSAPKSES